MTGYSSFSVSFTYAMCIARFPLWVATECRELLLVSFSTAIFSTWCCILVSQPFVLILRVREYLNLL